MKMSSLLPGEKAGTIAWSEHAGAVGHGIVSRAVLNTPQMRVVLFTFAADQTLTEHTSTARALLHVLGGAGEFQLGEESRTLRAGEILHLPPHLPHAVRAIEPMTMLLVLAPERKRE